MHGGTLLRVLTVVALTLGGTISVPVWGEPQSDEAPKPTGLSPKAIFDKDIKINPVTTSPSRKDAPGPIPVLRASVKLIGAGGGYAEVLPTRAFRSGEQIRLAFTANTAGYFYLATIGSSGNVQLLEPPPGKDPVMFQPGQTYEFPRSPHALQFGGPPGTEEIYAFFSETPLDMLDFGEGRQVRVGSGTSVAAATARDLGVVEVDVHAIYRGAAVGTSHIVQKLVLTHR